jgi:hypothetical protein
LLVRQDRRVHHGHRRSWCRRHSRRAAELRPERQLLDDSGEKKESRVRPISIVLRDCKPWRLCLGQDEQARATRLTFYKVGWPFDERVYWTDGRTGLDRMLVSLALNANSIVPPAKSVLNAALEGTP